MTTDGKSDYAKKWTYSGGCASYNGYSSNDYCEGAKTKKIVDHEAPIPMPAPSPSNHKASMSPSPTPPPAHYSAPSPAPGTNSAHGMSLATYVKKWTLGQLNKRVTSAATKRRQTQCWDLAMAAIEAARNAGFTVVKPGNYVWSNKVVPTSQAKAGDVAQFVSWAQKGKKIVHADGSWNIKGSCWTGPRHTAVVVKDYDGECFTTYDQNPSPVHETQYCPGRRTGGSVIIYRLGSSRLRLNDDQPIETGFESQGTPLSLILAASIGGVAVLSMAMRSILKKRRQSSTEEAPDRLLLRVESEAEDSLSNEDNLE